MKNNLTSQKGSIMIEALAMLGLIAMVTPVLYRKAAERTNELQDVNVASQIRMVSQAVDAYLKDHYPKGANAISTKKLDTGNNNDLAILNAIQAYLPEGFNLQASSKLFENFQIGIHNSSADIDNPVYTSAVVANLHNDMNKSRAAKIASMVGIAGGLVNSEGNFQGSQGAWDAEKSKFGFGDDDNFRENSLVAISNEAINTVVGEVNSDQVLYRVAQHDKPERNAMFTTLTMSGDSDIVFNGGGSGDITMDGGNITGVSQFSGTNMTLTGALSAAEGTIGGVSMNSGNVSATGRISAASADITNTIAAGDANISNNISAHMGTIGGVGMSGGNITASGTGDFGGLILRGNLNMSGNNIVNVSSITAASGIFGYLKLEGDLDMNENNIKNVENLDAKNLHAHSSLSVGGDDEKDGYNRYLYVGDIAADTATTLLVNQSGIHANATLGDDKKMTMDFGNGGFKIDSNYGSQFGFNGDEFNLRTSSGTSMQLNNTSGLTVKTDDNKTEFKIVNNAMTFSSNSGDDKIIYKNGNLIIGGSNIDADSIDTSFTTDDLGNASYDGNSIMITRDGVIKLVAPQANDTTYDGASHGYIEARRLVSDQAYGDFAGHDDDAWKALNAQFDDQNVTAYDRYQINPAYTSVMNDIKLATRGGARLSDILPDYINKGIYVADNTYKADESDANGGLAGIDKLMSATGNNEPSAEQLIKVMTDESRFCDTGNDQEESDCTASPWLGFIPFPQCPPAYDKVVTIEPFRWKMSEIYTITPISGDTETELKKVFNYTGGTSHHGTTKEFRQTFNTLHTVNGYIEGTHNFNEDYKIGISGSTSSNGGNDSAHTHTITTEPGNENDPHVTVNVAKAPAMVQANTWLNTTMREHKCRIGSDKNCGWSVLMGFLYPLSKYEDLARYTDALGQDDKAEGIAWNLFPVVQQNMASVVKVYCSFNRHHNAYNDKMVILQDADTNDGYWKWGDNTPVAHYDQLYRAMAESGAFLDNPDQKDADWERRVNDPSLGYNEAW